MDTGSCIYFSDFFNVHPGVIEEYGAFNVSLINDLPLFIDPFLLFNSDNPTYAELHENIISYLIFLRDKALAGGVGDGLLQVLYTFREVRQNWLGFSKSGNGGHGLGRRFARSLHDNLQSVFTSFGEEGITKSSHLEKLCLIDSGVGKDNISDFTTNLVKGYLLEYTQQFAEQFLESDQCRKFTVSRSSFNYSTGAWNRGTYYLPVFFNDYVLLTPRDILTKDDTWISRADMMHRLQEIADALPDEELRAQFNEYVKIKLIAEKDDKEKRAQVYEDALRLFPQLYDYYVQQQEDKGDEAVAVSSYQVSETQRQFIENVRTFVDTLLIGTGFYGVPGNTLEEARERVGYFKHVVEDCDGYKLFYDGSTPIRRETDLHLLYLLTWNATSSDVNREVNNGRGPVDFKVSRSSRDKSLVEFKLASNSKLKRNLEKQVEIYEAANRTTQSLKVIFYFTDAEEHKVAQILKELHQENNQNIILIDARADNKPSASVA